MVAADGSDEIDEELIDQAFADPEVAATQVPRLAAILDGEDNELAADIRETADEIAPPHLDDDEYVRATAAGFLGRFAEHMHDVVAAEAPTLIRELNAENETVRELVAHTVIFAASSDTEPFIEDVPELIDLLDSDDTNVQRAAVNAIKKVANTSSEAAVPAVNALVALLDADDSSVQEDAVFALMALAKDEPDAVVPAIDSLVALVHDPDLSTPVARTLSLIGRERLQAEGVLDTAMSEDR
jgi:HEAT repeat protein